MITCTKNTIILIHNSRGPFNRNTSGVTRQTVISSQKCLRNEHLPLWFLWCHDTLMQSPDLAETKRTRQWTVAFL